MLKFILALSLLSAAAATAQPASNSSGTPTPVKGDPNKVVCQKQEKIGSRLGGEKLCLTVSEWQMRQSADRDAAEQLQASTQAPCAEGCGRDLNFGDISQPH